MDKFPEAFARFEKAEDIDLSDVKSSEDIIRKFAYWQNRTVTLKQQSLIREIAKEKGLIISERKKGIGISRRKGVERKALKKRYTAVRYKTKKGEVRRILARDSKTGRYVKK